MVASAGRTWCPPGRWPRPVQSSVDTTTMTNEGNETTVQQTTSLYDRLGDVYNIVTVIDDLIDRVMADDRLNANPRVDEAHPPSVACGVQVLRH
jgi:hypothetical protein